MKDVENRKGGSEAACLRPLDCESSPEYTDFNNRHDVDDCEGEE